MAIPEQFLDELVARTDLVDLVSETVHLTKKGNSYWGCCPFHAEKSPSFHVVPERQMYKCFGCGKGGGIFSFVMHTQQLDFQDAVQLLAKRAGMAMPENTAQSAGLRVQRERLLEINRQAARAFHSWLNGAQGQQGLAYLTARGLSRKTITSFGLGFAPDGWDYLISVLGEQGYGKQDLLDAGLAASNKDGRIYDRFRNRIIFPIIDVRGAVIGFGGRVMDDSKPKYLNSPETLVYNKSRNMFALNLAKLAKEDCVILTEGYMDTIALHQAGFSNAVASLGTALTPEHAQLLARYFKQAVISYDSDQAGVAAAQRAITVLDRAGLETKVLRMNGAKDPDEFIKAYGRDAFAQLLTKSENQVDYRLVQLKNKFNLTDDAQKVTFLQQAAELVAGLYSPVEREIYGTHAAELGGISPESMAQEVSRALRRRVKKQDKQQQRENLAPVQQMQPKAKGLRYENPRSAKAEEGVLRLLSMDAQLYTMLEGLTGSEFSSPLLGRTFDLLYQRAASGMLTQISTLTGQLTAEEMDHLTHIVTQPQTLANVEKAMKNYISVIRQEGLLRAQGQGDEQLLAYQKKQRERKAYLEEKP